MREGTGKYKARRLDNGEWVYGSLICDGHIAYILPSIYNLIRGFVDEDCYKVDPETVCEFTGEPVYNERELYQGDIVTINPDTKIESVRKVVWKDGCFWLKGVKGNCAIAPLHLFKHRRKGLSNLVLIGNIHDEKEEG